MYCRMTNSVSPVPWFTTGADPVARYRTPQNSTTDKYIRDVGRIDRHESFIHNPRVLSEVACPEGPKEGSTRSSATFPS